MSHLHVSDGILPLWLWVGALIVALAIAGIGLYRLKSRHRMVPAVAVMAAVGLVAMNIPLGLPIHVNLSALSGIVLGPVNGFLAMFIVNLFNALIGHGGLTVIGVNSLLVGSEALIAGGIFYGLRKKKNILLIATVAIIIGLLTSSLLLMVTAEIAGQELVAIVAHGHDHGNTLTPGQGSFLSTFGTLVALPMAVWFAVELTVSLLVISYVNKVRGSWFDQGVEK